MEEDFGRLRGIGTEGRGGRLEDAVARLAEAQARTEERVGRLEDAIARLAEAQARTEERVGRLEDAVLRLDDAVAKLAEAQARTEERVGRLEDAVARLAEAQRRTEEEVRNLAIQVGRLSDTIGFTLEDIAKIVLPGYLERHLGIRVIQDELERRYFVIDGKELEINLYGEARRDGEEITIIGESKSRIYEREVREFIDELAILLPTIKGEVLRAMFGFVIHPSATRLAKEHGIILVASYQR